MVESVASDNSHMCAGVYVCKSFRKHSNAMQNWFTRHIEKMTSILNV